MNKIYENSLLNKVLIVISITGIIATFLMQDFSFLETWTLGEQQEFITRKVLRVILNDLFMLVFIAAWFKDKRVTNLAIAIQLADGLILLPIYLIIKLSMEGTSEISAPLLSQFHRIIINPTLMILLIPAVYFQRFSKEN
jgi:exosortase F-associated protein